MAWSNSTRSRAGTRCSGSRGAALPLPSAASPFAPCSPLAGLAARAGFSACSPFAERCGLSAFLAFLSSVSAIDLDSRTLGDANFLAIVAGADDFKADAGRLAVLRISERDIRHVDRRLFGDDAAFLGRTLRLVPLDDVDAAHQRAILAAAHLDDLAGAALVASGSDDDLVALFKSRGHHSTSGASEMIFMWFLERSSRGTGPKMRAPTGSIWGLISTAALRSKRMIDPSARLISLEMRTM